MGSKKKSKTNKLARMSEEEKLRYLQQRAAIEEEARRRKEQLISIFMKNKLKHEDAFSRLNSAKINQQWRQTLRQIKNNELHEAAETLHQTFDVAIQTKNKIIDTLLTDLSDSVAMHNLAVQTHLESINKIIEIEEKQLETLQSSYEAEREAKMKDAEAARSRGYFTFIDDKKQLDTDIYWQTVFHNNNQQRVVNLAQEFRNNYKYKALSKTKKEEEECANKIERLQLELKETLRNYNEALNPFISHYKQLKEADVNNMKFHLKNLRLISAQENKLKKAKRIKEVTDQLMKNTDEDFKNIMNEKQVMMDLMRIRLKQQQTESHQALKHLSSTSSAAIKHLETVCNKATGILFVNQNLRKYLTEKELYFPPQQLESMHAKCDEEDEGIEVLEQATRIFWKRHSEIVNEIAYLSAHQGSLVDQNIDLKHSLIKYMNTLANPSTLTSSIYRDSNKRTVCKSISTT